MVSAMMDRIRHECEARSAVKVHRVDVRIGAMAGVEPELLVSAWEICREGTPCAEAALVIENVPARWACPSCEEEIRPGAPLRCPGCGRSARMVSGDEILLDRIEMEVP